MKKFYYILGFIILIILAFKSMTLWGQLPFNYFENQIDPETLMNHKDLVDTKTGIPKKEIQFNPKQGSLTEPQIKPSKAETIITYVVLLSIILFIEHWVLR
jgi:hypothetical protein